MSQHGSMIFYLQVEVSGQNEMSILIGQYLSIDLKKNMVWVGNICKYCIPFELIIILCIDDMTNI